MSVWVIISDAISSPLIMDSCCFDQRRYCQGISHNACLRVARTCGFANIIDVDVGDCSSLATSRTKDLISMPCEPRSTIECREFTLLSLES